MIVGGRREGEGARRVRRWLKATATLAGLERTVRQAEELGYRLLSFMAGRAGGRPANLVTLLQAAGGAAPAPIHLEIVDGNLSRDAQEAQLNAGGKEIVSYSSLYVEGQERNVAVAAYR